MWRRPLTVIALIAAGLMCQGCMEFSGARLDAPTPAAGPAGHRWFARSCDALWPDALRVLASEGFRLVGKDPAGAIASFLWTDERRLGRLRATGELEAFIRNEGGFPGGAGSARVESAVLQAVPKNRGCEVSLRVGFAARRGSLGLKRGWVNVASSGKFEERLLARIEASARGERRGVVSVSARPAAPLIAAAHALPSEAPPGWQDSSNSEQTRVVRLGGED